MNDGTAQTERVDKEKNTVQGGAHWLQGVGEIASDIKYGEIKLKFTNGTLTDVIRQDNYKVVKPAA